MKRCTICQEWEEICSCEKVPPSAVKRFDLVLLSAPSPPAPRLELQPEEVEALRYARFVMGGSADFDRIPRDKCRQHSRTIDALLTRLGFGW